MLEMQYRMNADIMDWVSTNIYDGRLTAHPSVKSHLLHQLLNVKRNELTGKLSES